MVNVTAWSRTARVAAAMTGALAAASGMTVAATPAAGLRNGPPQRPPPRHIGPCSSSTAPGPGIGVIVPHLGAVLPSGPPVLLPGPGVREGDVRRAGQRPDQQARVPGRRARNVRRCAGGLARIMTPRTSAWPLPTRQRDQSEGIRPPLTGSRGLSLRQIPKVSCPGLQHPHLPQHSRIARTWPGFPRRPARPRSAMCHVHSLLQPALSSDSRASLARRWRRPGCPRMPPRGRRGRKTAWLSRRCE